MRMFAACVCKKVAEDLSAKFVMRQHASDGVLYNIGGPTFQQFLCSFVTKTTRITRIELVLLLIQLVAGETDFVGVDDDYVVATINMRGKAGFVLASQDVRHFAGKTSKCLTFSVYHKPLLGYG